MSIFQEYTKWIRYRKYFFIFISLLGLLNIFFGFILNIDFFPYHSNLQEILLFLLFYASGFLFFHLKLASYRKEFSEGEEQ